MSTESVSSLNGTLNRTIKQFEAHHQVEARNEHIPYTMSGSC